MKRFFIITTIFVFASCKSLNYSVSYNEKKLPKNQEHVQRYFLNKTHHQWNVAFESNFDKTRVLIYTNNKIIVNDTITTDESWSIAASYSISKKIKKIKVVITEKTYIIPFKKEYPFINISKKKNSISVEYAKSMRLLL